MDDYTQTSSSIARAADCAPALVRKYADAGLIDCVRSADGRRLFASSTAETVRALKAQRLARRGKARAA